MGCSSSSNSKELIEDKTLPTAGKVQPRAVSAKEYLQSIRDSLARLNEAVELPENEDKYSELSETLKEDKSKLARMKEQRKIDDSVYKYVNMEIQTLDNFFQIVDVKGNVVNFVKDIDSADDAGLLVKLEEYREAVKKVPRFRNGTRGRAIWEETYKLLDDTERTVKNKQQKTEHAAELDSIEENVAKLKGFESNALKFKDVVNNYRKTIENLKSEDEEIVQRKQALLDELDRLESDWTYRECDASLNEAKSSLDKILSEIGSLTKPTRTSAVVRDIVKKLTVLKKNSDKIVTCNEEISRKKQTLVKEIDDAIARVNNPEFEPKNEETIPGAELGSSEQTPKLPEVTAEPLSSGLTEEMSPKQLEVGGAPSLSSELAEEIPQQESENKPGVEPFATELVEELSQQQIEVKYEAEPISNQPDSTANLQTDEANQNSYSNQIELIETVITVPRDTEIVVEVAVSTILPSDNDLIEENTTKIEEVVSSTDNSIISKEDLPIQQSEPADDVLINHENGVMSINAAKADEPIINSDSNQESIAEDKLANDKELEPVINLHDENTTNQELLEENNRSSISEVQTESYQVNKQGASEDVEKQKPVDCFSIENGVEKDATSEVSVHVKPDTEEEKVKDEQSNVNNTLEKIIDK